MSEITRGACHCGRVAFEVEGRPADVVECNCSICRRTGYLHWFVPQDRFRLLAGADALTTYTFGTGVARHTFCATCGVKAFYTPRSHPDQLSVNVRCLDEVDLASLEVTPFDGVNWEQNIEKIR